MAISQRIARTAVCDACGAVEKNGETPDWVHDMSYPSWWGHIQLECVTSMNAPHCESRKKTKKYLHCRLNECLRTCFDRASAEIVTFLCLGNNVK